MAPYTFAYYYTIPLHIRNRENFINILRVHVIKMYAFLYTYLVNLTDTFPFSYVQNYAVNNPKITIPSTYDYYASNLVCVCVVYVNKK